MFKLAGIDTRRTAKAVATDLTSIGWGYVDQSSYAPALYKLQSLRNRIIKRTALTTLERLLVPIRGNKNTHLVLGYVHKAYPEIYATVAKAAAFNGVLLLKGVEGGLAPALNKPLRRFRFIGDLPDDIDSEKQRLELDVLFGAKSAAMKIDDQGDAVHQCLETGLDVLNGKKSLARDSLCLASAQIMNAYGSGLSLPKAVEKVQLCLDNGAAKERFNAAISP